MKKSVKKFLVPVAAVMLVMAMSVAGTLAYLQSQTDPMTNSFNTNKVMVSLREDKTDPYNIIPGTRQQKTPIVTVDATVDAYVYLVVIDNTQNAVEYTVDDSIWKQLEADDGTVIPGVYYTEIPGASAPQELTVLVKDKDGFEISYPASLTNDNMPSGDVTLSFKAYAIQKVNGTKDDGSYENTFFTPFGGYSQAVLGVPVDSVKTANDTASLTNAITALPEEGGTIVLTESVALANNVTISKPVTIVGDGSTKISGKPMTATADVTMQNMVIEKPETENKKGSIVYAQDGTENLVFDGCTFSNAPWEAVQITSNNFKTLVIKNCTFNANDVDSNPQPDYNTQSGEAIRYIHIQPSANPTVKITITDNTFNDCGKVKDSIVGIYYVSEQSQITVGRNTFNDWDDGDIVDGKAAKLSVGWPEVEKLKEVAVWEDDKLSTHTIK